jgi:RNA polymerase sporulation-specific sigma factor
MESLPTTTLELIKLTQKGDEQARAKVVNDNTSLVWSIVHRFKSPSYDKEDLFQIGCIGLLKAIDKFDETYNVQFSTYAVPIILGEIKKFFRDDGAIKVSRSLKETNIKINQVKHELSSKLNRNITIEDIANELKIPVEDVVLSMESSYYPTSLNEPYFQKDGSTLNFEDHLGADDSEKFNNLIALKAEMKKLDKKEQLLIYLRYYMDANQEEIAKRFGVSQVQISRMERKIIEKLRKQFV